VTAVGRVYCLMDSVGAAVVSVDEVSDADVVVATVEADEEVVEESDEVVERRL